jgi:hypothetical protein
MIRPDNEGVDAPGTPDRRSAEIADEALTVVIVAHDVLSPFAAGHDMTDRAWILNGKSSGHIPITPVRPRECQRPNY